MYGSPSQYSLSRFLCYRKLHPGAGSTDLRHPSRLPHRFRLLRPPCNTGAAPIPANAPRMSKETRYQIIRDFETQLVYSRTAFPMGNKGLILRNGTTTPNGQNLQQLLALWGPSIKPGDPAHISYIRIKDDHIHFDLNGGPIHRKKWYQHIQISGANGTAGSSVEGPRGQ